MNRMIYILKQLKMESKNKKLLNLLIFITLFFGFISSYYGYFYIKASVSNPNNQKDEYLRSFEFKTTNKYSLSLNDIEKIKTENANIDKISRSSLAYCSIKIDDHILNAFSVNVVDFETLKNSKNYNIKNDLNFDSYYSCIINRNFIKNHMNYSENEVIGKNIIVNGEYYKIIGVISAEYEKINIWIPATVFIDELDINCDTRYIITLKDNQNFEENINDFRVYMKDIFKSDINIITGEFAKQSNRKHLTFFIVEAIIIITGLLIFSLINIFNIIKNKFQDEKKTIAIKIALGATITDIFFQFSVEIFCVSIFSSIAVITALKIVTDLFEFNQIVHDYAAIDLSLFIFTIILSGIVSLILSLNAIRHIYKKSITEIMNGFWG